MDEIIATETTTEETTVVPAIAPEEDLEAKLAKLEEEKENYRKAYLKETSKKKEEPAEEDEDDRISRKVDERIAESRIVEIAREQDAIIQKALKENKELKLAQLNKKEPPAGMGAHSESIAVTDTAVTQEQLAYFKSKGWSDTDIERYKANLRRKV